MADARSERKRCRRAARIGAGRARQLRGKPFVGPVVLTRGSFDAPTQLRAQADITNEIGSVSRWHRDCVLRNPDSLRPGPGERERKEGARQSAEGRVVSAEDDDEDIDDGDIDDEAMPARPAK
jgi:hypothetical protein